MSEPTSRLDPRMVGASPTVASSPAPVASGAGVGSVLLLVAVALAETGALVTAHHLAPGPVAGMAAAGIHVATLAVVGLWVRSFVRANRDVSVPLLAWATTAALGPLGALAGAIMAASMPKPVPETAQLLDDWYARLASSVAVDPVTRLADDVMAGRTLDLVSAPPGSYLEVMTSGTNADRQTVLGLVARHFDPDYLPVLKAALKSPEPVIRVQAAAVAAHLQPEIRKAWRACVADLPTASRSAAGALALVARIDALVASGLLEEDERRHGLEIASRLGDVVLADVERALAPRPSGSVPSEAGRALEALLIERGRFAELRRHRSAVRALAGRPRARVRRLALTPSRAENAA